MLSQLDNPTAAMDREQPEQSQLARSEPGLSFTQPVGERHLQWPLPNLAVVKCFVIRVLDKGLLTL